ncbi:MAG: S9 family peptidase [Ignavibacteriales bacterium]|nr:S9 family peptidase [Ignavibacteriales bacterium]
MKTMQKVFLCLIAIGVSLMAQEKPSGWTPEVMIKFKRVGGTAISPNGKWIAYTVSTSMMDGEKSEFLTHIWSVSADGKTDNQFTYGDKSCTNPQFSPDGKYLSFVSTRGGSDAKSQVWIMRLSGGEAEQLTKAKSGVMGYQWSPNSKFVAYRSADAESEQEEKARKEKRDWILVDTNYKYAHLYTVAVEKDSRGNRKTQRLTGGEYQVNSFDISPDGRTIVFSHQSTPLVDDWPSTDISSVPADSGAVKSLVAWKGSDANPNFSPDGKWIVFSSDKGDSKWARAFDLYLMPAGGGEAKKLAETPDRSFGIAGWSADSKEVFVTETDRTSPRVFAVPTGGGKPRILTTGSGNYSGVSFSRDGGAMAFIHQTPQNPPDVYFSSTRRFEPKKLSDVNEDFPKLAMGKTEVISWKSKDGSEIEGLLTYPVNYEKGRRYPLILNIHGGPAGVFTQNFTAVGSVYPLQAFAQDGFAVLRPNPRGSGGYGATFRRANISDWGYGDLDDDLTGVDKVIEMGVAHTDSLIICGWSYGGYMTSFAITRTNRFKAASVGAGVTNLMSFVGTADIPSFLPSYFEGEFWDRMDAYMKHSAMFNVKNIQTPTQIIHGERDARVPISQGEELYIALKRRGVPVEMIRYPRTPHGPQEPKFIKDIGERMIAWFNAQLGRNGGGKVMGSK